MADAILMAGGTGGVSSDDVTAGKAQVLQGYRTITSDSDDEIIEGTIPVRGYHGPDSTEMWYYSQESGYVIRIEEGYYHKGGQWKPYILASPSLVKNAVNYHPEKTLSDTRTCEEQGQIKMVDTKLNNYTNNQARNIGIDSGRGKLWMEMGHGNAYYFRDDNVPHVEIDASKLGTAGADAVLQWQTASSQHGLKFEGTIPRWICTTGGVISAVNGEGFAWDDGYAGRGRGIVSKIPNGHFIQGANYVFLASPNLYPQNIRAGVNINGVVGTMPDYSTGRTVFNGATFDGILATGVASKGFFSNGNYYAHSIQPDYKYSGIYGGGMNLNINTSYPALRSRRIGCVLSQSINVTPFRQIVVYYRSVANIQGDPYTTLEAHVNRASTRRLVDVAGAGKVDAIDVLRQGTASPAINRTGQIVLNVADINEQAFISFGAYCNIDRGSDIFAGAVQITKIDFLN